MRRPDPNPRRIFIKGLNWVGDAIISTPAIAHIRRAHPAAVITLMVRPWVAPVFEHNPDINDLWVIDDSESTGEFFKAVKMVRGGRFDVGFAFPNSIRSALLMWLGGVKWRIGYDIGGRGALLNGGIDIDPKVLRLHQVFYYLNLTEDLCGPVGANTQLVLNPGEIEQEEVKLLLRRRGLDRGRPLIGIAPGSINSVAKRWPAERYAELADKLVSEQNTEVLLIGGTPEKAVIDRVASQCKAKVHNLVGELSLSQSIALIQRLSALVANDSGAMHIGAALGIPTLAIFGPTEWDVTYPFSKRAKILRKEGIDCAPCMLRECPIDHRCMTQISADDVMTALKNLFRDIRKAERAGK
ncbi:lipopolysaccharide heptosyltransferase II [bacterium]|nr:lipopolysaccharide heptosyltransferase II [bacterium]